MKLPYPLGFYKSLQNLSSQAGFIVGGRRRISPDNALTYRYFKFRYTALNGNPNFMLLGELKIMDGATEHPTSAMTSNSAPSPYVATESAYDGNPAYKAFNKVTAGGDQYWNSGTTSAAEITLDVGSGNEFSPSSFKVKSHDLSSILNSNPKDFTLQGSNNETDWDVIWTITGETSWSSEEEREFNSDT